jgi:hypothetical protein
MKDSKAESRERKPPGAAFRKVLCHPAAGGGGLENPSSRGRAAGSGVARGACWHGKGRPGAARANPPWRGPVLWQCGHVTRKKGLKPWKGQRLGRRSNMATGGGSWPNGCRPSGAGGRPPTRPFQGRIVRGRMAQGLAPLAMKCRPSGAGGRPPTRPFQGPMVQGLAPLAMNGRPSGAPGGPSQGLMVQGLMVQGLAPLAMDRRPSGAGGRPLPFQGLAPLAINGRPSGAEAGALPRAITDDEA